ncbi:MmgE/PrpD family protein [Pinirhizobacter sp.]|jgi:2-methylcitrate dehydratase PrpD|uniref:MmgE/PrpD family protein n=1 Tax=Pinirhizobacter sp. TaxID=2950432 RepID=UPI002F417B9D
MSKTRELGLFSSSLEYSDLPAEVAHYARRALVDWTAATIGAVDEPAAKKVRKVVAAAGPDGPANVIGTNITTNAVFAALANAYASHLLDFDDCYNPVETTIHMSSCLWGAILAIGQLRKLSGKDVLTAYVAGFETGARVARAAGSSHYQSAWHVTGVCGHVAAAAAVANALKLSPDAATNALGTAATQGAGIREVYGSDTKAIHPGKAAMDGVLSGLLAEAGFTSIDTAIEGQRGLLAAVSKDPAPGLLVEGLGHTWEILENGNKLYPTASLTHAPIEAATYAAESGLRASEIEGIVVRVHPFTAAVTAVMQPADGQAARFSTPHGIAVPLVHGKLTLADFDQAVIDDPVIKRLRDLVTLVGDKDMDRRGCELTIQTRTGKTLRFDVARNRGTPAVPLTDDELSKKFSDAAIGVLDPAVLAPVLHAMWNLDKEADVNAFVQQLTVAQRD